MVKALLASVVLASAAVTPADAQTFYGCGTFSCHMVQFTKIQTPSFVAFNRTWTQSLIVTWTHHFSETGGFFGFQPHFEFPSPIADPSIRSRFIDVDFYSSSLCPIGVTCRGTFTEWVGSTVDDDWTVNVVRVRAKAGPFSYTTPLNTLQPETINLTAVPEPETWALMVVGLGVVALVARRRRPAYLTAG